MSFAHMSPSLDRGSRASHRHYEQMTVIIRATQILSRAIDSNSVSESFKRIQSSKEMAKPGLQTSAVSKIY